MKCIVEYIVAMTFAVLLLVFNIFTFVTNRRNSKYPFLEKICILFILHDVFILPQQLSLYVVIEGQHKYDGKFLTEIIWVNAVSEFLTTTTFVHAMWIFAVMYHRIAQKLHVAV